VSTFLAFDVGGSGSRVAISSSHAPVRRLAAAERAAVTSEGSAVADVVGMLLREVAYEWPGELDDVVGVGIGATGLATLVDRPGRLVGLVEHELEKHVRATRPRPAVAVAIDAVTAHLGALGGEPGAVISLGTGAIAVGTDEKGEWRRVDGWGHLLGDRGGGAWIGRRGLEAAMRAYDGVDSEVASGAALLAAARRRFGEPFTWPAQLYTRADRAGVLAGFAFEVVGLAADGDEASGRILDEAGDEAARSVLAALGDGLPARVSATGGLVPVDGPLMNAFTAGVVTRRPDVEVRKPAGDGVDGALLLAERAAAGDVVAQEAFVWLEA
jgi:N-acetylglucosamine kinase-like BadF-type ATPase